LLEVPSFTRVGGRPRHEDDEIIFEGTLPRLRLSGVMVRVITRVITHTHTHTHTHQS